MSLLHMVMSVQLLTPGGVFIENIAGFSMEEDLAAMEKFYDENRGHAKADKVDGTKIDEMQNPTYNGKSVTKNFLKGLDAEMLGNLVFKNGRVTVGTGRHTDNDLVSNSPGSLPFEEGKVAHIHNHQLIGRFSVGWDISSGIIRRSRIVEGNPGAGPSSPDYSSSVRNTRYRNVVVDNKYVYFINGTQTVKHPR